MYKSIISLVLLFGVVITANAQYDRNKPFKPITIERGYFEITRLPSSRADGEIVVYDPDPETNERCDRCATRYRLDREFRISVGAHITTEISIEELVRLPSQIAYFRLYEKGTVGLIGFAELVEGDDLFNGI